MKGAELEDEGLCGRIGGLAIYLHASTIVDERFVRFAKVLFLGFSYTHKYRKEDCFFYGGEVRVCSSRLPNEGNLPKTHILYYVGSLGLRIC